jgi:hydrogenase maturation protein HypF
MDLKTSNIIQGYEIVIRGLVQGVGFRPFIYRLAAKYNLFGEVDNRINGVLVTVEGESKNIADFCDEIITNAPPASQIKSIEKKRKPVNGYHKFSIATSKVTDSRITEISPDIAVCSDCLRDMDNDPERIDYPFINCTNCGPRFTIIEKLPYDRDKTSMKDFKMCPDCSAEYNNILNRRFHAQPIACNKCGPFYTMLDSEKKLSRIEEILAEIAGRIKEGKSVAVKGLGGYHLICDAISDRAIIELRERKHRDAKPFAVMFRDLSAIREYCHLNTTEEAELISWRRPILILKQKKKLCDPVNSGLNTIGAILPYMPFHFLLFRKLQTPAIVLTSGNISDEPIITDDLDALNDLMPISGSVVYNDREILNRTDDSVIRVIDNKINLIRRSRGYVPAPVDIDRNADGIIALGAEQKSTFCIGKDNQAIMSQYIGDLKNLPTCNFYKESIKRFFSLFKFKPELIVCDLHPDYLSTSYAEHLGSQLHIPVIRVQHHHAHIASVMAENRLDEKVIGISMDGTGYGPDGNIWGGEFLVADLNEYSRYTHFDYMPMPGGDKAVDEPWRMAFSLLYKYLDKGIDYLRLPLFKSVNPQQIALVKEMIDKKINTPLTSGAGRIFDAVSAILGLCPVSKFDSEAPVRLESVTDPLTESYYPFDFGSSVVFAKTLKAILDDLPRSDISVISAKFHNTIAQMILTVSETMRRDTSIQKVALSGGVFQNKYLLERLTRLLTEKHFEVFTNHLVPSNDGGISLGQLIIASKIKRKCV